MTEVLIIVAVTGWSLVLALLWVNWQLRADVRASDHERYYYMHKLRSFCDMTYEIIKDWRLEGGFKCDDSFKQDFERKIME